MIARREEDGPIRPAYDPELASSLAAAGGVYVLDFDTAVLSAIQEDIRGRAGEWREELQASGLVIEDLWADAEDGYAIPLHHIYDPTSTSSRPCLFYIHGGGLVVGSPWDGMREFEQWSRDFGVSVVTVDYRLAPAVTAPTLVEDCYAGLLHVYDHASGIGIDRESIIVAGMSAGGGLAASVALLARDRRGPGLRGQLLMAPMLSPEGRSVSQRQSPDSPWNANENAAAWALALGDAVPEAAALQTPGLTADLRDLPPAFLEVGSAEIFRSEVAKYAEDIWRVGGNAELHVWAGGFHGFTSYPHATVAQGAMEARRNWLSRRLGYGPQEATQDARSPGATGEAG